MGLFLHHLRKARLVNVPPVPPPEPEPRRPLAARKKLLARKLAARQQPAPRPIRPTFEE